MLRKAQELFQEIGNCRLEAKLCRTVAGIHRDQGRPGEAARLAHEARGLCNKIKDWHTEVSLCMFASQCHLAVSEELAKSREAHTSHAVRAEWEKAMKSALAGKTLARKLGEPRLLADTLVTVGDVALVQTNSKDARSAAEEALMLFREFKHPSG